MSLTAISLFESATGKIFINATPKVRSNQRQENFHELDVYHVKKVGIRRFLAQEVEMSLTTISSLESEG